MFKPNVCACMIRARVYTFFNDTVGGYILGVFSRTSVRMLACVCNHVCTKSTTRSTGSTSIFQLQCIWSYHVMLFNDKYMYIYIDTREMPK